MIQRNNRRQTANGDIRPKWFNSPITFHQGALSDIRKHIPTFERRRFSLTQPGGKHLCINQRLDTIVRMPFGDDKNYIPVSVVSKDYVLVPHTDVLDVAINAIESIKIPTTDVNAELRITEYGERMSLSLYLPKQYNFDPGDHNSMSLRLECLNSVDGSTRFRALMGWFRFVCSNGLIIGVTKSDVRRRHVGDLRLEDVGLVLTSGLQESEIEKKNFELWSKTEIKQCRLANWVDKNVRDELGFKAAARTFHIARFGYDADILGQYKDNTPTTIAMEKTKRVPGSPTESRNIFDLSQILAWLAKERRDVQEQMEWREKVPWLIAPLLN